MVDLKTTSNGLFSCNGGAFFWVAHTDINGQWSDAVVAEVSKTAGCSKGSASPSKSVAPSENPSISLNPTYPTTSKPTSPPTTSKPSSPPTSKPSSSPTVAPPCGVGCPLGATGNYPTTNCYGFFQCEWGVLRNTVPCPGEFSRFSGIFPFRAIHFLPLLFQPARSSMFRLVYVIGVMPRLASAAWDRRLQSPPNQPQIR
jgi:hypothetical protein